MKVIKFGVWAIYEANSSGQGQVNNLAHEGLFILTGMG